MDIVTYALLNGGAPAGTTLGSLASDVSAMKSIGRYLSVWDCTTGLPQTDPTTMPYTYQTGDYYRIGVVADEDGTNYKPSGTTYTGAASTDVESGDPALGDIYIYDGTGWTLLKGAVLLDDHPVEGSTNAITSGGVFMALLQIYTKQELAALAETWTFTLADGTTVTKKVVVLP